MRLMKYNILAKHVPGKEMLVPDTLSRSPIDPETVSSTTKDVELYMSMVEDNMPASDAKQSAMMQEILKDFWTTVSYSVHTDWMAKIRERHTRKLKELV